MSQGLSKDNSSGHSMEKEEVDRRRGGKTTGMDLASSSRTADKMRWKGVVGKSSLVYQ